MDIGNYFENESKFPIFYNDDLLSTSLNITSNKSIIERINSKFSDDFCIIDIYSGIGSSSLIFLKQSSVGLVISFEENADSREMLKKNIYSQGNKDKSVVESTGFDFQNIEKYTGCCLFINNLENEVDFEKIADEYKNVVYVYYIYTKNPDNFNTSSKKYIVEKGDDYVIIVRNSKSDMKKFEENEWGLKENSESENINSMKNYKFNEEEVKKVISWKIFTKDLKGRSKNKKEYEKWSLEKYQTYVRSVLKYITGNGGDELIEEMTTPENMEIWVEAITHESYNLTANFERLETYGDNVLGYEMTQYLRKRFPDITPQGLTEYKSRYMSKEFQGIFTNDMKLTSWILVDETHISRKIQEDVFESFSGALLTIANNILEGLGPIYVLNFITLVLSDIKFNKEMYYGKPITQIQQRGGKVGLIPAVNYDDGNKKGVAKTYGATSSVSENKDDTYTAIINITDELINFLVIHFKRNFSEELTRAVGNTGAEAIEKAWDNALVILNKAGYTNDFADSYKEQHMFDNLDKKISSKVVEKAKLQKYSKLIFKEPKNSRTKNSVTIVFSGTDSKGIQRKLSIAQSGDVKSAQEKALKNYLEK